MKVLRSRSDSHGGLSTGIQILVYYVSYLFAKMDTLAFKIRSLLDTADYRTWLKNVLAATPTHTNKNSLILDLCATNVDYKVSHYIEFGVAFGETAKLISNNASGNYFYSGFDTFEGLPEAWRRLNAGAFSNGGQIPKIPLDNFNFHKGLVQNTLQDLKLVDNSRKVILFDFDLYQPTLWAFKELLPYLKKDDILYFDEAFDSCERIIIENYVLKELNVRFLSSTVFALALIIE